MLPQGRCYLSAYVLEARDYFDGLALGYEEIGDG